METRLHHIRSSTCSLSTGRAPSARVTLDGFPVPRHLGNTPSSRAYYQKKRAKGKSHSQVIRALGRQVIRCF
jgi:hypothetical protein